MNKKKELTRGVKFVLFSISAGVIEFASFALLDAICDQPDSSHQKAVSFVKRNKG